MKKQISVKMTVVDWGGAPQSEGAAVLAMDRQ